MESAGMLKFVSTILASDKDLVLVSQLNTAWLIHDMYV